MTKQIIWVVIISLIVGVAIFFFTKQENGQALTKPLMDKVSTERTPPPPSPSPKPTPIDENSNLAGEIEKLTPPEYTEDFKSLKESINQ